MHLAISSAYVPRLPSFLKCYKNPHVLLTFDKVHNPCACHAKRHLNVQKCSIPVSFLHFWLRNVLRATTACTFSTSQLPKVVRTTSKCAVRHNCVRFFDISTSKSGPNVRFFAFTCKSALRHNGVQFFISHLARWLRTRRFSQPTFRPPGATNHWKNTVCRDFPTFSRTWIFFLLILYPFDLLSSSLLFSSLLFSSLLFSSLLFSSLLSLPISALYLSILSEVWLLNFPRWLCFNLMYCI